LNETAAKIIKQAGPFRLTLISLIIALLGQFQMYFVKETISGMIFFLIAIIIFIAADISAKNKWDVYDNPKTGSSLYKQGMKKKTEIIFFILIMAVCIFFRFYSIDTAPPGLNRDEGEAVMDAYALSHGLQPGGGNSKLPVFINGFLFENPAVYSYVNGFIFRIIGPGITEARISTAVMCTLAVIAFYFLIRYLFGPEMAVVGGFLIAFMRYHATFSRFIYCVGFSTLFLFLLMYYLYRIYRERKLFDFLMFGLMFSLCQYTYNAAKAIPLAVFTAGLLIFAKDPGYYKKNILKFVIAAAVCVITLLPLADYILHNFPDYIYRTKILGIYYQPNFDTLSGNHSKSKLQVYLESCAREWLMFNQKGDSEIIYNEPGMPMIDFFTGIFAVLGFGYLIYRALALSPFACITLSMFFVFMFSAAFFMDAPHAPRSIMSLPFPIIFSVAFIERAYSHLREQYGKDMKNSFITILILILAASCLQNYDNMFNKHFKDIVADVAFDAAEYKSANYLLKLGDKWQGVFPQGYLDHNSPYFHWVEIDGIMLKNKKIQYGAFSPGINFPAQINGGKNTVYLLTPDYDSLIPVMEKMYPNGIYKQFYGQISDRLFFSYEVPNSDVSHYNNMKKASGFAVDYYSDISFTGKTIFSGFVPVIFYNGMLEDMPDKQAKSIKWHGMVESTVRGKYLIIIKSADYFRLEMDGKSVIESDGTKSQIELNLELENGIHSVTLYYRPLISHKIQFLWIKPGQDNAEIVPAYGLIRN